MRPISRQSMGQSDSRAPAASDHLNVLSSSFDSSCSMSSAATSTSLRGMQSTTSEDASGGCSGTKVQPVVVVRAGKSRGNRVASANARQTKTSGSPLASSSLSTSSALQSNGGMKKSLVVPSSSQAIIRYCMENAKDDLASRIILRMYHKREDFANFSGALSNEQWQTIVGELKEYLKKIVASVDDASKVRELSINFGIAQVPKRSWGFRADYFAVMANALTTECVFLDGAAHSATETIEAWATLVEIMFSSVRDGYYQQIRYLRKNSSTFKETFSSSVDSTDQVAINQSPLDREYSNQQIHSTKSQPAIPVMAPGTIVRF